MSQEWYYAKGDQKQGPITSEQLKGLAKSGDLKSTDLVWTEGMPEWKQAGAGQRDIPPGTLSFWTAAYPDRTSESDSLRGG
jgi:GYF domain 2